jgi:tetratricopeptide (TPR) repeat protein
VRRVLILVILTAFATCAQTPDKPFAKRTPPQGQLDSSEALFTVMAAINAAGFDQGANSPSNSELRAQVRNYLKAQDLKSVNKLEVFLREHRPNQASAELTQYVSYALSINGPPDFSYHYPADSLPPDVVDLQGLTPLLVEFYREAHLDDLWKRVQPAYDQAIGRFQAPIAHAVLQANAYLRNDTAGYLGRRFQIYVDLLGAPNQVQMRNYADDFYVVVTPAEEVPVEEIRHAYLHYMLDPLGLKFASVVRSKHAVGDYALGSPILEQQYKNDFVLLTTESLIKAVESRIDHKPARIDEALREGFVLAPALSEQLAVYEQQETAMRLYFPDLIKGIDMAREEKRLDHIDFYEQAPALRARTVTRQDKPPELAGVAKTLDDAEKAYSGRDLARAKDGYLQVLKQTGELTAHAKAYYGLARIAVLERDPELGDRLFRKVLELQPDPVTKSWSLLYLGRLADSQGDREQAQENYKAALAVAGAPDSVRQAAEKGLKEAFTKK